MEPFRDDNDLAAELRALRAEPRPEFTAELDESVAAGFPRRSARGSGPLSGTLARLRALPPRRLALAAGAAALAAVAVASVVVAVDEPGPDPASLAGLGPRERVGGAHLSDSSQRQPAKPSPGGPNEESSGAMHGAGIPSVVGSVAAPSRSASSGSASGSAGALESLSSGGSGPYASKARHRDVERSAEMVLGVDPSEVAGDAADVFDAVHAVDGIVLSSAVSGGAAGEAGARFELLIPAAKLGDALASFSAIDTVVSRHEATDDITAPTVRVGEHLRDSRAKIDGLLVQLAGADSEGERAEIEAELGTERRRAAALRSRATKLSRRANLSRVSLRIETGAAATSPDDNGSWGVGDALHDAGHILGIAAGVTIVGLAILAPLALIAWLAWLAWLANRTRLRRARERALV
jgi:uncharacterized protein DUF4349